MTTAFKLYSTSSCHLCEEAIVTLTQLHDPHIVWEEIEISESDDLLNSYGTRIPVLQHQPSGQELDWPFTTEDIARLVTSIR